MRPAVVTGMGIVSCLGSDLDTVSTALATGKSGIICDEARLERGFRSGLTTRLPDWDGGLRLSRKLRKSMHEPALYGTVAALDAVDDSGLDPERLKAWDVGLVIGNDSTVTASFDSVDKAQRAGYTRAVGSGSIFQVMCSTVTMNLSTILGTRGANWTVAAACASGAHAIGQGAMLIGSGQQEIMICGGAQELGWMSMAAFDALGAFSANGDPAKASRPFDQARDGLVPGGGAAVLVLESREHAEARGATIYGEIVSYAFSSNGTHLSCPSVDGPAWAMSRALELARLRPQDIDYVSAHATSTPVGDLHEGRALLEVFGAGGPPVSSTKSMTGHECWMSGASEVLYSLLMARSGFIAPNINLESLDDELKGLNVCTTPTSAALKTILSNSFGFGGMNSALILRCP